MREMIYIVSAKKFNVPLILEQILAALKTHGLDMSNTLFICTGTPFQAHSLSPIIIKAGAQYVMHINKDDFAKRRPDLLEAQKHFVNCHSVFDSLATLAKKSKLNFPQGSIKQVKATHNFITSLRIDDVEECTKLLCALSERDAMFIIDSCNHELRQANKLDHLYCDCFSWKYETAPKSLTHDKPISFKFKEEFHSFVRQQLTKNSWAQNHQAATEQDVKEVLKDYYSFLHFLALYCKPMLNKIREEYRFDEPQPTPIYLTGFEHLTEQEAEIVKKKGRYDKHIAYRSTHYWGWWYM